MGTLIPTKKIMGHQQIKRGEIFFFLLLIQSLTSFPSKKKKKKKKRHLGDLGNILSSSQKGCSFAISDKLVKLEGRYSVVGRTVVIHEGKDDLGRGKWGSSFVEIKMHFHKSNTHTTYNK